MTKKLKPCPFCGHTAILYRSYDGYRVQCNVCCNGTISYGQPQYAIKIWNMRVNEAKDNPVEQETSTNEQVQERLPLLRYETTPPDREREIVC